MTTASKTLAERKNRNFRVLQHRISCVQALFLLSS